MKDVIIFLNGEIDIGFCEQHIQNNFNDFDMICADGSYQKLSGSQYLSSKIIKIIGDFDSYLGTYDDRFIVDKDQETTDFEKVLNYLLAKEVRNSFVFGCAEGEMDHFINNMSIAKNYKNKINITFFDKFSKYFFIPNEFTIEGVKDKMFSVIPFGYAKNIYYNGLKYSLAGDDLELGHRTGTRNYAINDKVEISYSAGSVLLFISHKKYKDRL